MSTNALLTPLTVGDITLKNRIVVSATTRNRAENTYPTEVMKDYYVQRALGGAGLIVTEGILVTRQGTEWTHAPGIWDAKHVAGWKNITEAVHEAGGKIYAQLWHVGRLAHPEAPEQILSREPVYGPSAIGARGGHFRNVPGNPGYVTPTEIPDPSVLVETFRQAAINAKEAGFDGVELHGANGYVNAQFLDSTANHRTDKWGGSVENRSRFGLEVLKALISVFGVNVAVKLSPCGGYNDVGMPVKETLDTYSYFVNEADKLNLAYIVLVRYHPYFDVKFDGVSRITNHDVLASYRLCIKSAKVVLNAGVAPKEGEELVASGNIDAVAFGVNWITHPDLGKRIEHGKPLDNPPNFPFMQANKSAEDWTTGYTDYPTAASVY